MSDDTSKPRLIIVAGPNGAGKTSITEQLLRHEWLGGCEYVNADFIAKEKFKMIKQLNKSCMAPVHLFHRWDSSGSVPCFLFVGFHCAVCS